MDFHERQLERQSFTQRSLLVVALLLIFIVVILFRTFSLQISNFTEFDKASLNNRTYSVPVQPLRGKILDRNGEVISENIATFDLVTTPRDIKDVDEFLEKIEKIIDNFNQLEPLFESLNRLSEIISLLTDPLGSEG